MATFPITFTLSYTGELSDEQEIDFYDVAQALVGFERSLALTAHLVLNGEVITHANKVEGVRITALPPKAGSWEFVAVLAVVGGALYKMGTAPKDTPIGHLIRSAYDYVISEALGFHVDYEQTIGQQYEELKRRDLQIKPLPQSKFDAAIEKSEVAIRNMHRPIAWSETASSAEVVASIGGAEQLVGHALTRETFDYMYYSATSDVPEEIVGRVSSYNVNTFKGRIYVEEENRPIPFELTSEAKNVESVSLVIESLRLNAQHRSAGDIRCMAYRITSRTGRVKAFIIFELSRMGEGSETAL